MSRKYMENSALSKEKFELEQIITSSSLAEIEINYKPGTKPSERLKVTSSVDCANVLRAVWSDRMEHIEEFLILCLNRANQVLGWAKISVGGVSGTVADPKLIFQIALKTNSSSLVLCHNHPSGNEKPSPADISLTNKVKEAGKLLDLPVLHHIILTSESYYSFADEGLI